MAEPVVRPDQAAESETRKPANERRTRRLTADIPDRDAETLGQIARVTGFNKVTTLVRAIRVLAELVNAEEHGGVVTIKYPDGARERLIIR